ncbi:hypothetical protein CEJ86_30295 [Sinorhizobium meliloti]|uniref:Uncharacterized protein n=1 Tax=Rhizobium meliloti TaxID=382 RepID=A0A2J0YU29_RHIML|nr:hypothetical protein CEJ86_30295 [Sinorhizobium meliloti]
MLGKGTGKEFLEKKQEAHWSRLPAPVDARGGDGEEGDALLLGGLVLCDAGPPIYTPTERKRE